MQQVQQELIPLRKLACLGAGRIAGHRLQGGMAGKAGQMPKLTQYERGSAPAPKLMLECDLAHW